MISYVYSDLGLPRESYDLWEERRAIFSYTTVSVIAGLKAAAALSTVLKKPKNAKRYSEAAKRMEEGMRKHLVDPESQTLMRSIQYKNGEIIRDNAVDISLFAAPIVGVMPVDDPIWINTHNKIKADLWVNTSVGGMARYKDDYYFRRSYDVPGNPWIIGTATYYRVEAMMQQDKETKKAKILEGLNWILRHSKGTGALSEQIHPFTGEHLSVAPLVWSHAEYVNLLVDYLELT